MLERLKVLESFGAKRSGRYARVLCAHVEDRPALHRSPLIFPTCNCERRYNNGQSVATHHYFSIWNRRTPWTCRPPGARRRTSILRIDRDVSRQSTVVGGAWGLKSFDLRRHKHRNMHAYAGAGNYSHLRTSMVFLSRWSWVRFRPAGLPAATLCGRPACACGYQLMIVVTSDGIFYQCRPWWCVRPVVYILEHFNGSLEVKMIWTIHSCQYSTVSQNQLCIMMSSVHNRMCCGLVSFLGHVCNCFLLLFR
jgi:hypothetical protein